MIASMLTTSDKKRIARTAARDASLKPIGSRLPIPLYRLVKREATEQNVTVQQFLRGVLVIYFDSPADHKNKVLEVARAA